MHKTKNKIGMGESLVRLSNKKLIFYSVSNEGLTPNNKEENDNNSPFKILKTLKF